MRWAWIAAGGAALGLLSRVEERTAGFSAGISSDSAWLAAAFAAGVVVARRRSWAAAAAGGALTLTAANAAYYAWIAAFEPSRPLASVAGPVAPWFLLGLTGGAVFGTAGGAWVRGGWHRLAASLALGAILIVEGSGALRRSRCDLDSAA